MKSTGAVSFVAQTFLSAGFGDFPVPKVIEAHGAGKHREPADKNICATVREHLSSYYAARFLLRISALAISLGSRKVGLSGKPVPGLELWATPIRSCVIQSISSRGTVMDWPLVNVRRSGAPLIVAC